MHVVTVGLTSVCIYFRSFGTSLEAWIVLGVVLFGASFVLCFTWIMFFYVLRRNKREHDEFLQVFVLL